MLVELVKEGNDGAEEVLSKLLGGSDVERRTANTISLVEIKELFGLTFDREIGEPWSLRKDQLVEVPKIVFDYLNTFYDAGYDESSEATCRIAADILMVPAVAYARRALGLVDTFKKHNSGRPHSERSSSSSTSPLSSSSSSSAFARGSSLARLPIKETAEPSTPVAAGIFLAEEPKTPPKQMQIFPEVELEVVLVHKNGKKFIVTGKPDWAASPGDRQQSQDGSAMIAVEAKQLSTFSAATKQLLCCLGMCRYLRQQASEHNETVQGFQTDGSRYQFFCIKDNGHVLSSEIYDIRFAKNLQLAFSWIVAMLQTTAFASPSTTPVKEEKEKTVLPSVFKGGIEVFDEDSDEDLYIVQI